MYGVNVREEQKTEPTSLLTCSEGRQVARELPIKLTLVYKAVDGQAPAPVLDQSLLRVLNHQSSNFTLDASGQTEIQVHILSLIAHPAPSGNLTCPHLVVLHPDEQWRVEDVSKNHRKQVMACACYA